MNISVANLFLRVIDEVLRRDSWLLERWSVTLILVIK